MSFLKRLFGGGDKPAAGEPQQVGEAEEYKGFTIRPTPFQADGQYQTCGVISREVDGVLKEHRFIRADRFAGADDAASIALQKGRQIIDEQGDTIFTA